jgi:hypothetical protein
LCSRGLFQLSTDHARVGSTGAVDPSGDAPLTRVISEHVPNEIASYCEPAISEPGFLIACTDGAYAYFSTPVHFELALWSALEMQTQEEQVAALEASIGHVTQDDASLVLIPVGIGQTEEFATRERRSQLHASHKAYEDIASALREAKLQTAKLEAAIERVRGGMQAIPRSMLGVGGEA